MSQLIDLIPKVSAQEVDATSQPTFGSINVNTGSTTNSSIRVVSDATSVVVGGKFKVKVEVKSNQITINQYRLVIDFDQTKLSVVDQDTATQGTQIKLLDTIFVVENPSQDNIVSNTGRITLIAKTSSGNAFQVNREVAEIEFQARESGNPTIKVAQGTNLSQLIRQSGVGIGFNANQVTVQISTQQTPGDGNGGTNQPTPTNPIPTIPITGINDDINTIFGLGLGIGFIILGTKLLIEKIRNQQ